MVYQNPGAALNPSLRIGTQVAEAFTVLGVPAKEAMERAREALVKVQIADPASVLGRYPHQLSGGMQQRVVIAMALAKEPELLILDEPTTGLDATVEAEVLDLVSSLQSEFDTAVLFISHNLGVISKMCSRVGVLYAGRLVEEGPVGTVLQDPRHPYTVGLLRCIPRGGVRKDKGRLDTIPGFLPSLGAEIPGCVFADRCALADDRCRTEEPELTEPAPRPSRALLLPGSGAGPAARGGRESRRCRRSTARPRRCSRSTTSGRCSSSAGTTCMRSSASPPRSGRVRRSGWSASRAAARPPSPERCSGSCRRRRDPRRSRAATLAPTYQKRSRDDLRSIQIVFQNPDSALNRRHSVQRILLRSMKKLVGVTGSAADARVRELAGRVRITERTLTQKPVQLSGGLKQRVAIARAFAGDPKLVVCDEPTSALDVSVQAAILNLLVELQAEQRVSYLFISHDLGVVRYISDRIAVLYLGRLMELGPADVVFDGPHHPYTEALLSAVPTVDGGGRERIRLEGDIPSAADPPSGCVFHNRCPRRIGPICDETEPPLVEVEQDHLMRCHIPIDELRALQLPAAAAAEA